MQDKILYFQCNDRQPTPKEASKFIEHIRGDLFANEDDRYGIATAKQWIKTNELCVNLYINDMSYYYWVTCKESWLEMFFPELMLYANEIPIDESIFGDGKFYLKYEERNFDLHCISEMTYNLDADERDRCVDVWYVLDKSDNSLTRFEKK